MLDLRVPSGWFFALLGLILVVTSVVAPDYRAALSDSNVNLYCGVFMLAFGGFLLGLAWRAKKNA